jgi:hypothetical protein
VQEEVGSLAQRYAEVREGKKAFKESSFFLVNDWDWYLMFEGEVLFPELVGGYHLIDMFKESRTKRTQSKIDLDNEFRCILHNTIW